MTAPASQHWTLWVAGSRTDTRKAAAAIAALPELLSLGLAGTGSAKQKRKVLADLLLPTQLTRLSLSPDFYTPQELSQLNQLSGLVNLQHLDVSSARNYGNEDCMAWWHESQAWQGLPTQLSKLTCLRIGYTPSYDGLTIQQLSHLSGLISLQQLAIKNSSLSTAQISGMLQLMQLTAL